MRCALWSILLGLGSTISLASCGSGRLSDPRDAAPVDSLVIRIPDLGAATGSGGALGGAGGAGPTAGAGGSAGSTTSDAGQVTPVCQVEGGPCNTGSDYCCDGFTCGATSLQSGYYCMKNCVAHGECSTGCCAPLGDSGITVCLDQVFCPSIFCHKAEEPCLDGLPCCEGLACAVFGTTTQTSACKPRCTDHAECATGCCAPLGDSGIKVCLGQSYCPSVFCLAEDEPCQGGLPCCDGLVCAVFETSPPSSACKPICEENADCESECCVSLGTDAPSACLDKSFCLAPP
jgi:hypothetical protein